MKKNNEFKVDNLQAEVYSNASLMGSAAAGFVAEKLKEAIDKKGSANLILATGASQFTFLEALIKEEVEWQKITVFHLDEYKGISDQHPASFRKYLKDRILSSVNPKEVYYLNGDAADIVAEVKRYEELLMNHEIDVACIGIGENGHIAFNDPPIADFNDPKLVKIVELDNDCRMQQFGEGWFPTIDDVPKEALTLTITAIMNCSVISCVVPDERKSTAVKNALFGEISTKCPASVLRRHSDTRLFLDVPAATLLI